MIENIAEPNRIIKEIVSTLNPASGAAIAEESPNDNPPLNGLVMAPRLVNPVRANRLDLLIFLIFLVAYPMP